MKFTAEDGSTVTVAEIAREIHHRIAARYAEELPPKSHRRPFRESYVPDHPLQATGPEGTGPVRAIVFEGDVEYEFHLLAVLLTAYEQIEHEGILVWAGTASTTVSDRELHFRVVLIPDERGLPTGRGPMEITGAPEDALVQIILGWI
jgi:hypothetical protein